MISSTGGMRKLLISVFGKNIDYKPHWGFAKIPQPAKDEDAKMDIGDITWDEIKCSLNEKR